MSHTATDSCRRDAPLSTQILQICLHRWAWKSSDKAAATPERLFIWALEMHLQVLALGGLPRAGRVESKAVKREKNQRKKKRRLRARQRRCSPGLPPPPAPLREHSGPGPGPAVPAQPRAGPPPRPPAKDEPGEKPERGKFWPNRARGSAAPRSRSRSSSARTWGRREGEALSGDLQRR